MAKDKDFDRRLIVPEDRRINIYGIPLLMAFCIIIGALLGYMFQSDGKVIPLGTCHPTYLCTDHFVSAYYNCAKPFENRTGEYCDGRIVCENMW